MIQTIHLRSINYSIQRSKPLEYKQANLHLLHNPTKRVKKIITALGKTRENKYTPKVPVRMDRALESPLRILSFPLCLLVILGWWKETVRSNKL